MRALVSGGSSGIGAATCLRLAEAALARADRPMIAVCGNRSNTGQDEVVRSIRSMGGTATVLEPQARPGCLPRPFAKVRTLHGTLDARRGAIRGQPRTGRARKKEAPNLVFFGGDGGI